MGDVLQHHRFTGARRRHDQGALTLADGTDQIDDAGGGVLQFRVVLLHLQVFIGIKRRQVVEIDAVTNFTGVGEINLINFQKSKIPLPFLGRANFTFHGVAGPEGEAPNLTGGYVNIIRARQVIGFRATQEAEAVLEHFKHADAENSDVVFRQLLEDREHHVLLAQRRGVFDFQFFGKGQKITGGFGFKFLKVHGACLLS